MSDERPPLEASDPQWMRDALLEAEAGAAPSYARDLERVRGVATRRRAKKMQRIVAGGGAALMVVTGIAVGKLSSADHSRVKSSTSRNKMYGSAMRIAISTVSSHGGGVPISAATRATRMMNAVAPKKRVMSACARVGWRRVCSATLLKIST